MNTIIDKEYFFYKARARFNKIKDDKFYIKKLNLNLITNLKVMNDITVEAYLPLESSEELNICVRLRISDDAQNIIAEYYCNFNIEGNYKDKLVIRDEDGILIKTSEL
jgi:hypothetical protein